MLGNLARTVKKKVNFCRVLVEKREGKKQLGIPERRWECNIKIGIKVVRRILDWIKLFHDRNQRTRQ